MGIGGKAKLTNSQPICNDHAIPPNSHPKVSSHSLEGTTKRKTNVRAQLKYNGLN
jgi:hypothetical protein